MDLFKNDQPKILAFSGSLRAQSYNKKILEVAIRGVEAAGGVVTHVNLADFPMPIYNKDDHERNGFDTDAFRFQELVVAHNAFLIASPSYNGSLPAGLKNAIDWATRTNKHYSKADIFQGKSAAILAASPGSFGSLRVLGHLRGVLTSIGLYVHPTEIAVPFVHEKFDAAGQMQDEKTAQILTDLGHSLVEMVVRLTPEFASVNGRKRDLS